MVADPWTKYEFMTRPEREHFKRLRDIGAVSFFRSSTCIACGEEILKGKKYCSETCMEKMEEENDDEES